MNEMKMNENKLISLKVATVDQLKDCAVYYQDALLLGNMNRYTGQFTYTLIVKVAPKLNLEFGQGYRTSIDGQRRTVGVLEEADMALLALDRKIPFEKIEGVFSLKLGVWVRFITGEAGYENVDGTPAKFYKAECRLSRSVVTSIFLSRKQVDLVERLKLDLKAIVVEKIEDSAYEDYNDDVFVEKSDKKKVEVKAAGKE